MPGVCEHKGATGKVGRFEFCLLVRPSRTHKLR
jgi:hypothetical protein